MITTKTEDPSNFERNTAVKPFGVFFNFLNDPVGFAVSVMVHCREHKVGNEFFFCLVVKA